MGDSGEGWEEKNGVRNGESQGCILEVSDENEDSMGNWTGVQACYLLAIMFTSCPDTLCEAIWSWWTSLSDGENFEEAKHSGI